MVDPIISYFIYAGKSSSLCNLPSLYQYLLTIGFGIQFWWFIRKLGNFNFYLVVYPFMILYFLIVFFYSVSLTWRGKVIWKDRFLDAKAGLK